MWSDGIISDGITLRSTFAAFQINPSPNMRGNELLGGDLRSLPLLSRFFLQMQAH